MVKHSHIRGNFRLGILFPILTLMAGCLPATMTPWVKSNTPHPNQTLNLHPMPGFDEKAIAKTAHSEQEDIYQRVSMLLQTLEKMNDERKVLISRFKKAEEDLVFKDDALKEATEQTLLLNVELTRFRRELEDWDRRFKKDASYKGKYESLKQKYREELDEIFQNLQQIEKEKKLPKKGLDPELLQG